MKIGLDFDGVISDCGKLMSDGAKKLHVIDIPSAKFKKEIVVGEKHLTMEQYRGLQKIIYGTREIGFLMELVDGVLHFLPQLVADGHTVLVVTSRGEVELEIAKEWSTHLNVAVDGGDVGIEFSPSHFYEREHEFVLVFRWCFSVVHIVDFAFPVQYTTCTGQKQPILSNTSKITCLKT